MAYLAKNGVLALGGSFVYITLRCPLLLVAITTVMPYTVISIFKDLYNTNNIIGNTPVARIEDFDKVSISQESRKWGGVRLDVLVFEMRHEPFLKAVSRF